MALNNKATETIGSILDRRAVEGFRNDFLSHVKETNIPESWRLFDKNSRPNSEDGFQIITPFDVNKNNRKGELVYCSECHKPKFYEGGFLIRDGRGLFHFIGPNCGKKFYGIDRFQMQIASADRFAKLDQAETSLLNAISTISQERMNAKVLLNKAKQAQSFIDRAAKMDGKLKGLLKRALRNDGNLTVTDTQNEFDKYGNVKQVQIERTIATITGYDLFYTNINIVEKMHEASGDLQKTFGGMADESECLKSLTHLEENNQLVHHYMQYRKGTSAMREIEKIIENVLAFFSYENYQQLQSWGTDSRNEIRLSVTAKRNIRRIARITNGNCRHLKLESTLFD